MVGNKKTRLQFYDDEMWCAYNEEDSNKLNELWKEIKTDKEVLKEAIKPTKTKWAQDTVMSRAICHFILCDYKNVDEDIYMELINLIYSNKSIARLYYEGETTAAWSFLHLTLLNHNLELTEKQKKFAVEEANNKRRTVAYYKKDGNEEFRDQVHGIYPFDIRYQILTNPNWSMEEKAEFVYDFYALDDDWENVLDEFELSIVNDLVRDNEQLDPYIEKEKLYSYIYENLEINKSKEIKDSVCEDIIMCKLFHQMRPQRWELECNTETPMVLTKKNDQI